MALDGTDSAAGGKDDDWEGEGEEEEVASEARGDKAADVEAADAGGVTTVFTFLFPPFFPPAYVTDLSGCHTQLQV